MRQALARQAKIPGFPYFFLVRWPLVVHVAVVWLWITEHGWSESTCGDGRMLLATAEMFMFLCWLTQPFAVVIAIVTSRKAGASNALLPNMAILCGCLQIALLVWIFVRRAMGSD